MERITKKHPLKEGDVVIDRVTKERGVIKEKASNGLDWVVVWARDIYTGVVHSEAELKKRCRRGI